MLLFEFALPEITPNKFVARPNVDVSGAAEKARPATPRDDAWLGCGSEEYLCVTIQRDASKIRYRRSDTVSTAELQS